MNQTRDELRAYYESEAEHRLRNPLKGRRVDIRARYLELLAAEGRRSVVDFGAGPGGDGLGFLSAGHSYIGLDLALGNAYLATEAGVTVVQGSITAPPFRRGAFDAGWSMSTLMHLPEPEVPAAVVAMAEALITGAPLMVGLWGGDRADVVSESEELGRRRLFSRRPVELNRRLLEPIGTIEDQSAWDAGPGGAATGLQYQQFLVRVGR